MGSIPSVSLPSIITCRACDCTSICYAHKIERLRPTVRSAYQNNLSILQNDPQQYWREIEAALMLNRYFRFHVAGDIPDDLYFEKMVELTRRQCHCNVLCFTKRYDIVNRYIEKYGCLPVNLHVILSAWRGLKMENPYCLPEAHVQYKDGSTTAPDNAVSCGGNCSECAQKSGGCWTLGSGEAIVFQEH